MPVGRVFAAFSAGLAVSALTGPGAGRLIDRIGGPPVLTASNLIAAAGLALLAGATGEAMVWAAWLLIGLGMGCGLYEAAFSALARLYGRSARGPITGITLFAGFASTVSWPLTAALEAEVGWRGATLAWAVLLLAVALPLNVTLPRSVARPAADDPAEDPPRHPSRLALVLLASIFAVTWFLSTAMAVHLPRVLELAGATPAAAVAAAALVGPAQVAGRVLEYSLLRRASPLVSARAATLAHPLGVGLVMATGAPAAPVFAALHGGGNGVMTIVSGTLPLALFGPAGYGRRQGWLAAPGRLAAVAAPLVFALLLQRLGLGALWVSAGLGLLSFGAVLALGRIARA